MDRGLILYNSEYKPYLIPMDAVQAVLQQLIDQGVGIEPSIWAQLALYNSDSQQVIGELDEDGASLVVRTVERFPDLAPIVRAEMLGWPVDKFKAFEYVYHETRGDQDILTAVFKIQLDELDYILEVMFS